MFKESCFFPMIPVFWNVITKAVTILYKKVEEMTKGDKRVSFKKIQLHTKIGEFPLWSPIFETEKGFRFFNWKEI